MKDKRFNAITIPLDNVAPEFIKLICLVADKEYDEAFQRLDEHISKVEDAEQKNIALMIFLQVLALAGYEKIASILLKALQKNFKVHSKARHLCQRTIKNL